MCMKIAGYYVNTEVPGILSLTLAKTLMLNCPYLLTLTNEENFKRHCSILWKKTVVNLFFTVRLINKTKHCSKTLARRV